MIDNISQISYSKYERIDNNTILQNELDDDDVYHIYLHNCLSKISRVLSLMNKDISELKNQNQNKSSYFNFLEDYSKSNNMTLKEAMIDIKKRDYIRKGQRVQRILIYKKLI